MIHTHISEFFLLTTFISIRPLEILEADKPARLIRIKIKNSSNLDSFYGAYYPQPTHSNKKKQLYGVLYLQP